MTHDDLAFIADALIALCDRPSDRPFYTEAAMRSKLKLADTRDPLYANCLLPRGDDPLLQDECQAVFERAGLTDRQFDVLNRRLEGWTFEEIGQAGGHSKQGAQSIFIQALKKLTRTFRVYPFRGLSDVYREETRRGAHGSRSGKIPVHVLR